MAFVNEKISEEDKARILQIISFEKAKALAMWIPRIHEPSRWTVDHETGAYLVCLVGSGREDLAYYALGIEDNFAILNLDQKVTGDGTSGLEYYWFVQNLSLPNHFEHRRDEIKKLIDESLNEYSYFSPFADGGTVGNPNTKSRLKALLFTVTFH